MNRLGMNRLVKDASDAVKRHIENFGQKMPNIDDYIAFLEELEDEVATRMQAAKDDRRRNGRGGE